MFGSVVLLPIKALATDSIQGATSLRTLSWRGRLDIVLHTVLFFLVLWILPYRTMRQAKMAALGLESAPLVMPDLVLRMCCLFTCFQTTLGAFFGVFTQVWPRPFVHTILPQSYRWVVSHITPTSTYSAPT